MTRLVVVVAVLALVTSGCRTDGLRFTNDRRVTWVTPDRAVVGLPFTLDWDLDEFAMVGPDGSSDPDAGYVAVFVDRSPPAPFQAVESLADDDETCTADPGCPDTAWFEARGIHLVTHGTSVTIDRVPGTPEPGRRERHDITLVLLDGQGRRQGEGAWRLHLELDRDGS